MLLCVLAAGTKPRGGVDKHGPAAFLAVYDRLAQHASDHGAATPPAAGTRAYAGALADLLKCLRAGLNRFEHDAFADLVAQAGGL